ncbi:MAG TPA: hypothetical protein VD864_18450 [Nocardioides sp.]|nr:hypothetical protein [Nocardioides sp.]
MLPSTTRGRMLRCLASTALGLSLAAQVPPAGAAGETCRGEAATVVGDPGERLDGTTGPDVIVTNGATYTDAMAGDDVVCVTGGSVGHEDPVVDAGDGADVVDTTEASATRVHSYLGDGDDRFIGGRVADDVDAANAWSRPAARGHDTVSTGGGADVVTTGGQRPEDADDIDLGPGRDEVSVQGVVDPEHPLLGGRGSDRIELERRSLVSGLAIDNDAETASTDGRVVMRWDGFENFRISPTGPWTPPSFTGGPGAERVWSAIPLTSVELGDGDDAVELDLERQRTVDHVTYAGGAGADSFVLHAAAGDSARRVRLDLVTHRLRYTIHEAAAQARITGFERHRLSAKRLLVDGTPGPDRVEWTGCHGHIAGGAGDDILRAIDIDDVGCGYPVPDSDIPVRGGRGDDLLVGAFGWDVLLGGPGDDVARGGRGRDHCVAETVQRCES